VKDLTAISAAGLGAIHRDIGISQNVFRVLVRPFDQRDSGTRANERFAPGK